MRKILTLIILLTAANLCGAQTVYNYVNQGFNMMLEMEGTGNEAAWLGGVSCTMGYQVNPNVFIGGGIKNTWGRRRDFRSHYRNHPNYNTESGKPEYWVDPDGVRHTFHAFDINGNEVFYDYPYDSRYGEWNENFTEFVYTDLYDADGNPIPSIDNSYDDDECCGFWFEDSMWKLVPYICFKYNVLGYARVTPYADLRLGWDIVRSNENLRHGLDLNIMAGTRFAIRDGDQAINLSAGIAISDLEGYTDDNVLGIEKMFMLRFGFEF